MKKMNFHRGSGTIEGKTVKDLEEFLSSGHESTYGGFIEIFHQWKILFIGLGIGLFLLYLAGAGWSHRQEIIAMQGEIARLESENAALKKQLSGQTTVKEPDEFIYHHIRSGDSFSSISKQYYGTEKYASPLARINGISTSAQLNLGQVIKVPREPDKSWEAQDQ